MVPQMDDQSVTKKEEWVEIKTTIEDIANRQQSKTETANSMVNEVRTALLSMRKHQVEFQEHRHQLLDRQQQVDQHAQETKTHWDE